jgi:hypothetical protein
MKNKMAKINKIGNSIKEFPIFLWVEMAILKTSTD